MTRRSRDYYKPGDWNAICDSCGFKFKASELRKRWDGMMVCQEDWEPRHPQDFLRARKDRQAVPWTRSETTNFLVYPSDPVGDKAIFLEGPTVSEYVRLGGKYVENDVLRGDAVEVDAYANARTTKGSSYGKYYYELESYIEYDFYNNSFGVSQSDLNLDVQFGLTANEFALSYTVAGQSVLFNAGSSTLLVNGGYSPITAGPHVFMVAVDLDRGMLWGGYGGVWWGNGGLGNPVDGTNPCAILPSATYYPTFGLGVIDSRYIYNNAFTDFIYTPPAGYYSGFYVTE